jgi:hypothetical protein
MQFPSIISLKLLSFWKLSIVLFSVWKTTFQRLNSASVLRWKPIQLGSIEKGYSLPPDTSNNNTRQDIQTKHNINHRRELRQTPKKLHTWDLTPMIIRNFLYVVFGLICSTLASFKHILWPSSYACWANFDFSIRPWVRLHFCSLMRTSKGLLVSTSAADTWNTVHTLLRLLGIPNRSSFQQCAMECTFSFENGPDIETVPNTSEFLGNTPNKWDNNRAMIYYTWRRTVASRWLHYRVDEFLYSLSIRCK